MIENYYYPNEEEKQRPTSNFEVQATPSEFVLQYSQSEQKVVASSTEKEKVMELIEKAGILRSSREKEIVAEQEAIDESIENVEKVLNNINRHIKSKLESNWFTSLRDSLYKPVEKESRLFSKSNSHPIPSQTHPGVHRLRANAQQKTQVLSLRQSQGKHTQQQIQLLSAAEPEKARLLTVQNSNNLR